MSLGLYLNCDMRTIFEGLLGALRRRDKVLRRGGRTKGQVPGCLQLTHVDFERHLSDSPGDPFYKDPAVLYDAIASFLQGYTDLNTLPEPCGDRIPTLAVRMAISCKSTLPV